MNLRDAGRVDRIQEVLLLCLVLGSVSHNDIYASFSITLVIFVSLLFTISQYRKSVIVDRSRHDHPVERLESLDVFGHLVAVERTEATFKVYDAQVITKNV